MQGPPLLIVIFTPAFLFLFIFFARDYGELRLPFLDVTNYF